MIHMITDPKPVLDELSYAGASPQVGGEPSGFRASEKCFLQFPLGLLIQFRGTARGGARLQAAVAAVPEGSIPSPNATSFQVLWASGWSHRTLLMQLSIVQLSPIFRQFQ